jgi:hypothetical protein
MTRFRAEAAVVGAKLQNEAEQLRFMTARVAARAAVPLILR